MAGSLALHLLLFQSGECFTVEGNKHTHTHTQTHTHAGIILVLLQLRKGVLIQNSVSHLLKKTDNLKEI